MQKDLSEILAVPQDSITEDQIHQLLTKYSDDHRVSQLIEDLGYEKLKNHIPRLIELAQHIRSVGDSVVKILYDGGKEVLSFVQDACRTSTWSNYAWFSFIYNILDNWNRDIIEGLKADILNGCSRVAQDDCVIETLAMLFKNQVLSDQELFSYFHSLQPSYVVNLSASDFVQLVELKVVLEHMEAWSFIPVQADIQSIIDRLTDFQLKELTSMKYIKNTQAGVLMMHLGFEKLKNYTANLLEFLQDINWPAAGYAAQVLEEGEKEVIPAIKEVFTTQLDDPTWCYWIMTNIVAQCSQEVIYELKAEILNLSREEFRNGCKKGAIEYLVILYKDEASDKARKELLAYFNSITSELNIEKTEQELLQAVEQEIWKQKSDRMNI